VICFDINTFYSPKGGGIRTYHNAKISWFKGRKEHRYILAYPAAAYRLLEPDSQVTLLEAFGPAMTKDPAGYRLLMDFLHVLKHIRRVTPDVLEAGDPWLTGLFCLALKKAGYYDGLVSSFYHSDPIRSYLEPWSGHGRFRSGKRLLCGVLGWMFYRLQNRYDITFVSSRIMEEHLRRKGVRSVAYLPFGVPALFLEADGNRKSGSSPRRDADGQVRILYAGRLDREKGIELLLAALPDLLARDNVHVTVIGRGAYADRFADWKHERFTYLGFVDTPMKIRDIYDSQDIFIAPGPYETFGLGVLEAMARGMVVVGPDQGGTAEMLRQAGSPFIFRSGDGKDFLRATSAAIACDREVEAERSRKLARSYGTWDQAVGRMVEHYASIRAGW
jgi:alpha-1,6-mannosyltransferase